MLSKKSNPIQGLKMIRFHFLQWNWFLLFATLPITSLPLLASISGSMVAPPATIFVILLFVIWLIPDLIKKGKLPYHLKPMLLFCLTAIFSTILAIITYIPPFKDISIFNSAIKGLATLIIGMGFYLIISTYLRTEGLLRTTLQIINWSGLMILLWTFLREGFWFTTHAYPAVIEHIQSLFSVGELGTGRAFGLTMEPSWFAHQLNMLYLPLWLSATVSKVSSHKFKMGFVTFENLLLAMGVTALGLTLSRVGIAAFFLMLAAIFIGLNIKIIGYIKLKLAAAGTGKKLFNKKMLGTVNAVLILTFIFAYAGLLYGSMVVFTKVDQRMADLFTFDASSENPVLDYADNLRLGERVAYWIAGWNIFNDHPLMGVGIGLAGYYMPEKLDPFSRMMVEVRRILYRSVFLMNIKSIWIRVLAETGIVGFCSFFVWLYTLFSSSKFLQQSQNRTFKLIGKAGIFMILAFLLEGFSVDSFALPYLWVTAGLITATSIMEYGFVSSSVNGIRNG
jgi:hypothetical protein